MSKRYLLMPVLITIVVLGSALGSGAFHSSDIPLGGTVTGEVVVKRQGPMTGGTVFFFDDSSGIPPSPTKYWVVPDYAVKIDAFSKFTARLPEGTYYMGIIDRSPDELGPPADGDYFLISRDQKGNPKKLTVWNNATIDLGRLDGAQPFKKSSLETKGVTALEGTISDIHGNTVGGLVVSAFAKPDMMGKPLFVSERTGLDGKFVLRVNKGGKYYLMARAVYGGEFPSADEFIGAYKDGKPVTVKTGATKKGIDILVWPASMYYE